MILGLTGSIGSGKSFVTDCLERLGALAVRADDLAREVVAPGTEGLAQVTREFGPGILKPDGSLDRSALAAIVFSNPEKRRRLEAIVHPRVRQREEEIIAANRDRPLIVLEIPLLYESGAEVLCDRILVVTIDEQERLRRLLRDRGMTPQQVQERLAAQMPQEEKARRADYLVDNSGTREQTRARAEELYRTLTA